MNAWEMKRLEGIKRMMVTTDFEPATMQALGFLMTMVETLWAKLDDAEAKLQEVGDFE